ncbi:MAG: transcription termination factor NusA [Gemmataceae bacterium]|nr:transcription termination factor NusA [Gemmataceae bacterium]
MTTQTNDKLRAGMELIKAVDVLNNEKGIPHDTVFVAIERAVRLAVGKFYGDDDNVEVTIDRRQGIIAASKGEKVIDVTSGELGRIAAQAAKQQMIQLFREEESNTLLGDLSRLKGQLLPQAGIIQRVEGGAAIVSVGKTEAILPRGEMIPGETPHPGEKIKALVKDVRKSGHRIKVVLSRADELFVQRLFEMKVPEIDDKTIKIERVAREAGYRTKVAVSSIDQRVDCVGACVGVRGSRIKEITEELGGSERIDIVRWNASEEQLIRNALQPADIEEVFLYDLLRRAIVLVREDQLSLAIGKRGQNVRLASKLVDWDIEIMTGDELNNAITGAEEKFMKLTGATPESVNKLIENGCLSYEDIEPLTTNEVMAICGVDEDTADEMIIEAAEAVEAAAKEPRQGKREGIRQQGPAASSSQQKFDSLFIKDGPPAVAPETALAAGVSEGEVPPEALADAPAEAPAEAPAPPAEGEVPRS